MPTEVEVKIIKKAFKLACKMMQKEHLKSRKISFNLSGTTMASVFIIDNEAVVCNIGDSRIIHIQNGKAKQITVDHTPSEEADRIRLAGGLVVQSFDEESQEYYGPHRVWNRKMTYPGLALSRSLGDLYAHSLGVTEEPDLHHFYAEKEDIIVIASDGIWEVLSNQQVAQILNSYLMHENPDSREASEFLIEVARA